jgi:hypothetical protein
MKELLLVAIVISLFLLAACTEQAEEMADESGDGGAGLDAGGDSAQAGAEDEKTTSGSIIDELKDFAAKKAEYYVKYNIEGTDQEMTSMAQWFKGDKLRMDTVTSSGEGRTYMLGKDFIVCTKEGTWTCIKMTSGDESYEGQDMPDSELDDDMLAELEAVQSKIKKLADRTVAGEKCSCYAWSFNTEGSYEYCYSKKGIPMYIDVKSESGNWRMTATDFSTSVSDSDFELPAEPQDMEDMMEQAMQQMAGGAMD